MFYWHSWKKAEFQIGLRANLRQWPIIWIIPQEFTYLSSFINAKRFWSVITSADVSMDKDNRNRLETGIRREIYEIRQLTLVLPFFMYTHCNNAVMYLNARAFKEHKPFDSWQFRSVSKLFVTIFKTTPVILQTPVAKGIRTSKPVGTLIDECAIRLSLGTSYLNVWMCMVALNVPFKCTHFRKHKGFMLWTWVCSFWKNREIE